MMPFSLRSSSSLAHQRSFYEEIPHEATTEGGRLAEKEEQCESLIVSSSSVKENYNNSNNNYYYNSNITHRHHSSNKNARHWSLWWRRPNQPGPSPFHQHRVSWRMLVWMTLAGLVLFVTILRSKDDLSYSSSSSYTLLSSKSSSSQSSSPHQAVIPTLLSLIHPETNTFLYALDNELYKTLAKLSDHVMTHTSTLSSDQMPYEAKEASYNSNNNIDIDIDETLWSRIIVEPPTLNVDRTHVRYGESLLVTWTPGRTVSGEAVLRNDSSSILILTCGNVPDEQPLSSFSSSSSSLFLDENFVVPGHAPPIALEHRVVLEAATLEQVRATSAFHKGHTPMIQSSDAVMLSMIHQDPKIHARRRDDHAFHHHHDDDDDHNHHAHRRLGDNKGGSSSSSSSSSSSDAASATATTAAADPSASNNEWYIPSFPIIRQEACQFLLYDMERSEQGIAHEGHHHRIHHTQYHLLAVSNLFRLSSVTTPTAIHLALTPDPTKLTVQFVTGSAGTPVVEYDVLPLTKDRLSFRVEGTSDTYTAADMCEAPANLTELGKFQSPGYLHTVVLNQLKPNHAYAYRVGLLTGQGVTWAPSEEEHAGGGGGGGGLHTYNFTAPLAPGDGQSFSYLVYGDQGCPARGWGMGGAWTSAMAAREVHAPVQASFSHNDRTTTGIRAVHHFGDLSYAQGAAHIWDEWFAMIQPFSVYVPLMVAVGNHEYDHVTGGGPGKDPSGVDTPHGYQPAWGNFHNDSGGECGVPTAKRFAMPQSSSTSNGVFWYSHEFGSVHTTVLSSEHDLAPGSVQHVWLQDDLAAVNRTKTPWLIVELHRPLYEAEAEWDNNAVGIARRMEIEDLLYDNKVDVVLAGHYHAYHRTCDGLYRSRCRRGGPMHITVGSAGAHLDETGLYWNGWTEKFIQQQYGYGRITVQNATALRFEFVKAGSENDTTAGEVHDDVWILRDRRN